jgi:chemotaxis protein CheD
MSAAAEARRYYDARFEATIVTVAPGDHAVTSNPEEIISTVLGSCVAACLRDPSKGLGGVNHFLLPASQDAGAAADRGSDHAMRYGDTAMEILINSLMRRGADRPRLEAKIFGGARVLSGPTSLGIGARNVDFVTKFLKREGIPIMAADVEGERSRRLYYHPGSGRAWIHHLDRPSASDVAREEQAYRQKLEKGPRGGAVELFR